MTKEKKYRKFSYKEKTWIMRFQKIMAKAPDTLFMYVGEGVSIYPKDRNNNVYRSGDSPDTNGPESFNIYTPMHCDGGAA